MKVSNVKYYSELEFETYLNLQGVSYSTIKGFEGPPPAGMTLGKRVHSYLLEPATYQWEDVQQVKEIATALRKYLGPALEVLEKEVSFTAHFTHNELTMIYKGRADLLKAGKIVVDLKILSGGLEPAIDRYGYDKQVSGYCLATGSPIGIIIAYNKTRKQVERQIIKPDAAFWEYTTVQRCIIPE